MLTPIAILVAAFVGAFLIGSIPFGYVIGRVFYRIDIRTRGSGNIGAMNALRTLGKSGALAVLLLDALKGLAPTILALLFFDARPETDGFPSNGPIVGSFVAFGAVLGHCFSPWLRFRGGKGVATSFGATFALCWPAGLMGVAAWIAGAALTRYSSVGSMLGSILAAVSIWLVTRSLPETIYGALSALLILFMHRDNIMRLREGTESAIRAPRPRT